MKKKKKSNNEADEPCIVCGKEGEGLVTYHHLFTQKVYPEFAHHEWNRIPVCQKHHNEFHAKGTVHMAEKYLKVHLWLIKREWFYCETVKKWRRDGF